MDQKVRVSSPRNTPRSEGPADSSKKHFGRPGGPNVFELHFTRPCRAVLCAVGPSDLQKTRALLVLRKFTTPFAIAQSAPPAAESMSTLRRGHGTRLDQFLQTPQSMLLRLLAIAVQENGMPPGVARALIIVEPIIADHQQLVRP
jgi:hypothetical protein